MLHASLPFDAKLLRHTFERIEAGLYSPVKRGLSVDAQNLIMRFLQPNPAYRISVERALAHPWLKHAPPMTRGASVPDVKHVQALGSESPFLRPLSAKSVLNASLQQPVSPHGTPTTLPAAAEAVAVAEAAADADDEVSGSSSSLSSDSLASETSLELAPTAPATDGTEGAKANVALLP
jgi:serine/threonine protein kinase